MTRKVKVKSPSKSVKLAIGHDRLTLVAKYATGGSLRFTVGRSGERLTWGGSNDATEVKTQMAKFMAFAQFRLGETNQTRMERVKAIAESANSIAELVAKI